MIFPQRLLLGLFIFCNFSFISLVCARTHDLTEYVNPFIGTAAHGHTFPGATAPFGMVQLSPDTRTEGWDSCSGYHDSDSTIIGFSHTHLSGTGVPDYGDILLAPSVDTDFLNPGTGNFPRGKDGYRSHFRKETEVAKPGYYRVHLEDYQVLAELTTTERAGFHRYTFPTRENARILLDLQHRGDQRVIESFINVVSETEVEGLRRSSDWAQDQYVYFYAVFSRPFSKYTLYPHGTHSSHNKGAFFFDTRENQEVLVKVGISAVSAQNAKENLLAEIPHWSFEQTRLETKAKWQEQLSKITVHSQKRENLIKFYTSLYHTMIAPNIFMDVDGSYRGEDRLIHRGDNFVNYTVFSLWDTFRTFHPLMTIIEQKRTQDFINSLLQRYEESGLLPVWELAANETGTMIGYHSVSVIADAMMKDIKGFDWHKAYQASVKSAEQDHLGLKDYRRLGYVPQDLEHESVSKTLEYAYDDWTIAQMRMKLNLPSGESSESSGVSDTEEANFRRRSQFYNNLWDPQTQLMRPKNANGSWMVPFNPYRTNRGYTEANAWQYTLYVPHDVPGLIKLFGGEEGMARRLDQLFTDQTPPPGDAPPDMSGMIGQYAHGNEPSHHIPYLYQYTHRPHTAQFRIRQIMDELYTTGRDGLSGNEDCGQMSAWFIFSALGFYPLAPGSNKYTYGSPLVESAEIHLENGKVFKILAHHNDSDYRYVKEIKLNGKVVEGVELDHQELMKGGLLEFTMSMNQQ